MNKRNRPRFSDTHDGSRAPKKKAHTDIVSVTRSASNSTSGKTTAQISLPKMPVFRPLPEIDDI